MQKNFLFIWCKYFRIKYKYK